MGTKDYLAKLKDLIDEALDKYLPSENKRPEIIHKAMRYGVFSGGKRIRPILALEACRTCGAQFRKAMPAACAIELIHTYSLIHDDLPSMDDDDYRRGRPACHKAFGEANAILAGDALLTLAFNIIAKDFSSPNDRPGTGMAIMKELSSAIGTEGMIGGQVIDIAFKEKDKDEKQLYHINLLKTAKLFEASAKLGAMAGTSRKAAIDAMARYGLSLGMAFQIADDMIDEEGYAQLLGRDKARRQAEGLIEKAKGSLKSFGRKARRLGEIADYLSKRTD